VAAAERHARWAAVVTLQDLGSIGEFIAAIATVVTLVYLAIQIRQNTRSVRTAAFQEASRDFTESIDHMSRDPDLCRIYLAGAKDFESLPREERLRFSIYFTGVLRRCENLLYQTREGMVNRDDWEGVRETVRQTFALPGVVTWWKRSHGLFNAELRDFIEHEVL
jgi:hypothetical protein